MTGLNLDQRIEKSEIQKEEERQRRIKFAKKFLHTVLSPRIPSPRRDFVAPEGFKEIKVVYDPSKEDEKND